MTTPSKNKPTFNLIAVSGEGEDATFIKIGAVWKNRGDTVGFNGRIDVIPTDITALKNLIMLHPIVKDNLDENPDR